jgi:hypothetical protein
MCRDRPGLRQSRWLSRNLERKRGANHKAATIQEGRSFTVAVLKVNPRTCREIGHGSSPLKRRCSSAGESPARDQLSHPVTVETEKEVKMRRSFR